MKINLEFESAEERVEVLSSVAGQKLPEGDLDLAESLLINKLTSQVLSARMQGRAMERQQAMRLQRSLAKEMGSK